MLIQSGKGARWQDGCQRTNSDCLPLPLHILATRMQCSLVRAHSDNLRQPFIWTQSPKPALRRNCNLIWSWICQINHQFSFWKPRCWFRYNGRPAQLAELSRSEFDPELFSHSASHVKFFVTFAKKVPFLTFCDKMWQFATEIFPGTFVLRSGMFWNVLQFSINPHTPRVSGKLQNLPNMASVSQNKYARKIIFFHVFGFLLLSLPWIFFYRVCV